MPHIECTLVASKICTQQAFILLASNSYVIELSSARKHVAKIFILVQTLFEQGNKCFVLALALNRVDMHNKCTRVLYPKMHVSCSFLSLVTITAISVRASLVKLPCKGLQTCTIFKNARQESPNTRVMHTRL